MNNKIYEKINNIKDLLDGKYKERDNLLKEGNIECFNIVDKEIINMEFEVKKLEKDLEKSDMNNNYKNIKIIKNKRDCINKSKCYNETCPFVHPVNWNPEDNKIECLNCKKGFCNKCNKKYKHIYNNSKFKFIVNKIILINRIIKFLEKNEYKNQKKEEIINTDELKNIISEKNIIINNNLNIIKACKQDIKNIIYLMEKDLELYSEKIINNLDDISLDIYIKNNMKLQLNNIKSKIQLLKYNFEDLNL